MTYKPDRTDLSPPITYTDCQFSAAYVTGFPQSIWDSADTVTLERFNTDVQGSSLIPQVKLYQSKYEPSVVGVYDVTVQLTWAYGTATQMVTF